jgi:hypothetical protein
MSRIQTRVSTIAICAAVALPLLAAEKLGAKTGLWETTTTMTMGGGAMPAMPAIPPEMLANMPPAQRAQMEQAMQVMSGKPTTVKSCVTEKDLEQGAFRQQAQQDTQCTFTVVSSTAKRQETTFQCTTPTGPADGKLAVDVVDANHVKGTMQVKAMQMSIESKFESKWLGADCGATK